MGSILRGSVVACFVASGENHDVTLATNDGLGGAFDAKGVAPSFVDFEIPKPEQPATSADKVSAAQRAQTFVARLRTADPRATK
jgi:hypothetical protein